MQNTETDVEDINPEHFLENSSPPISEHPKDDSTTAVAAERAQNFSFASTYTASRLHSTNNNPISSLLSSSSLSIKPISAFTILGSDDTHFSSFTGKPNAIVRPTRRPEQPALPRPQHANSTDAETHFQQHQPAASLAVTHPQPTRHRQDVNYFAEELNRKLSFLHHRVHRGAWTKSGNSSQNGSNQESLSKRPLFITTVPSGVFLPPAKEIPLPPCLRRRIYAYSSQPVVLDSYHNGTGSNRSAPFSKDKHRDDTAAIVSSDKEPPINTSRINGIRGYSQALASGVHLTKQQFQQQIQHNRAKRCGAQPAEPYKNIMFEKRVIRGSNYTQQPASITLEIDPFDKAAEMRRRNILRKKAKNPRNVLGTPPPVCGRRHEVMQTDKYLQELFERPAEVSIETQTDLFLERPPTPPFKPSKVGIDVSTEIADGELFHFDAEAQPIIDVLVDACMEQSILEVAHHQEIDEIRRKQKEFISLREKEMAELRRLEAEEARLQLEKERRLRQEEIAKNFDLSMQKKVTAAKLLQGHIAGLLPEVLDNLEPASEISKRDHLRATVCPWLSAEVAEEVGSIVDSREILTVIIEEIIKQRAEAYAGYQEPEAPISICPTDEAEEFAVLEACPCLSDTTDGKSTNCSDTI